MSTTLELKTKLIEKINSTTNEDLLREATRLLEIELNEIELPFQLSQEMKTGIFEGKLQLENGQFLSNEEANFQASQWLEE